MNEFAIIIIINVITSWKSGLGEIVSSYISTPLSVDLQLPSTVKKIGDLLKEKFRK